MGIALLLTGIGFFILTLGGALGAFAVPRRKTAAEPSGKLLSAGGDVHQHSDFSLDPPAGPAPAGPRCCPG